MSRTQQIAYLGCSFAIGVFAAFNNFTLTLWLAGLTTSYLVLGLMGNTRSFEGALISPVFGAWSDKTWAGWLGRRRPYILVGGVLSALILALTPAIARLPWAALVPALPVEAAVLVGPIVAIFLFTFTYNIMDDIHKALLVDLTPPAERNRLSAWSVVVMMAGQVGILVLGFLLWNDGVPDSAFVITAALLLAGVLATVVGVREPPPAVWEASQRYAEPAPTAVLGAMGEGAGEASPAPQGTLARLLTLRHYHGAMVFGLVYFCYWSGVNAVMPLVSVYTRDILGASVGEAQLLPGLLLFSTTVLALPMARLGDRFGKRWVMSAGFALMGAGALAGLVITTREQGAVVFLLAGVGNAASLVLTVPLLADLVPRQHMGAATGLLAASGSVAAPIASLAGGALADVFGPRAIFAIMAVMVGVALALMPAIRAPAPETLVLAHDDPGGVRPLEARGVSDG
jgi:maltose/moltooligosaccharide transporter